MTGVVRGSDLSDVAGDSLGVTSGVDGTDNWTANGTSVTSATSVLVTSAAALVADDCLVCRVSASTRLSTLLRLLLPLPELAVPPLFLSTSKTMGVNLYFGADADLVFATSEELSVEAGAVLLCSPAAGLADFLSPAFTSAASFSRFLRMISSNDLTPSASGDFWFANRTNIPDQFGDIFINSIWNVLLTRKADNITIFSYCMTSVFSLEDDTVMWKTVIPR